MLGQHVANVAPVWSTFRTAPCRKLQMPLARETVQGPATGSVLMASVYAKRAGSENHAQIPSPVHAKTTAITRGSAFLVFANVTMSIMGNLVNLINAPRRQNAQTTGCAVKANAFVRRSPLATRVTSCAVLQT